MVIGRPLEFDPERALEQAMHVFWSQGYEATSLRDLLAAMGLSKSSFYAAFDSKSELFQRCLSHYVDTLAVQMREAGRQADAGRRFVEDTFLALAGEAGTEEGERGCLFWNTAVELGQRDVHVARIIAHGIERFAAVFAAAAKRAQSEGEVGAEHDPEILGHYLLASMSGLRSLIKGGIDRNHARKVVRTMLRALG